MLLDQGAQSPFSGVLAPWPPADCVYSCSVSFLICSASLSFCFERCLICSISSSISHTGGQLRVAPKWRAVLDQSTNHCCHRGNDEGDAPLLLEADAAAGEGDVVIRGKEGDQAKNHSRAGLDGTEVIQAGPGAPGVAGGTGGARQQRVQGLPITSSTLCSSAVPPGEHRQVGRLPWARWRFKPRPWPRSHRSASALPAGGAGGGSRQGRQRPRRLGRGLVRQGSKASPVRQRSCRQGAPAQPPVLLPAGLVGGRSCRQRSLCRRQKENRSPGSLDAIGYRQRHWGSTNPQ